MWAQVNELLFNKYFGTRPVTSLHNLCLPKDGWTGGWLRACTVRQGSSISSPQAKSGPRRRNNWLAEQCQNHKSAKEIYYIFFKIYFSVLTIYIFTFIINERLILVKFSSIIQDTV